jgi:hypothetical protein
MKRFFLISLLISIFLTAHAQLSIETDGDVIIGQGSTSYFQLQVNGQMGITCTPNATSGYIFTNFNADPLIKPEWNNAARIGISSHKILSIYSTWLNYDHLNDFSDIRMKENIRDIKSPLASIRQIKGIQYDRKREYYANSPEDRVDELVEAGKNKYGVVAQELKEVLPELVKFNDEAELYMVNYVGMIPILVEAMKEQQIQIEELQSSIIQLESSNVLKSASINTSSDESELNSIKTSLFQNIPNPFSEQTRIEYYLADGVKTATIFIYDMSGKQLKSYNLYHKNEGSITIQGGALNAGMYMYSLIADGKVIGTKQMILTKD